jgi:hypothetical protein
VQPAFPRRVENVGDSRMEGRGDSIRDKVLPQAASSFRTSNPVQCKANQHVILLLQRHARWWVVPSCSLTQPGMLFRWKVRSLALHRYQGIRFMWMEHKIFMTQTKWMVHRPGISVVMLTLLLVRYSIAILLPSHTETCLRTRSNSQHYHAHSRGRKAYDRTS